MGAIVIRTRYDEGTESAEVATSGCSPDYFFRNVNKIPMKKKACIVDINKNSWKNTLDNHPSTLTFVIYRHPVTLFTRDADWMTQAGYWFILRFCEHFTCLSSKFQNAIKLENISNLIASPSSYQCMRRKTRLVHFVIHGRHTSMECMCAY
jgi:hypothetical protein